MSTQDSDLFIREMAGVVPLKNSNIPALKKSETVTPGQQYRQQKAQFSEREINGPLSLVLKKALSVDDWISYKRNGIQSGVFKNLRLGKYPLEATLTLFRKTPGEARDELLFFIHQCQQCGLRSVLVTFGRDRRHGTLLKSYLAQWLPECEQVQASHTALKHHGGVGSIYVLLRKSEEKRLENRERHAARLGG